MTLDVEAMQAEIDTALDAKEAEKETAAGIKGAEVSEETTIENTEEQTPQTEQVEQTEADREEAEAKKVLGDEEVTKDSTTDIDETTPVQFNDTTLARAVSCGITLSEARSFPDNATLARFVDNVESNLLPPPESKVESVKDDEPGLFDDLPKLNPDDYSPEVIQVLDRYKEVLVQQQEQIKASAERADSVTDSVRQSGAAEMATWYDKAVADLGDDYKDALGEGAFASLSESSQHRETREDIAGKIAMMHSGYVAGGELPPSRDELFEMAVRMVLPSQQSGIERRKLAGELEKQASQHISRASGAGGQSTRTPEDETAAMLDERYG